MVMICVSNAIYRAHGRVIMTPLDGRNPQLRRNLVKLVFTLRGRKVCGEIYELL